MTVQVTHALPQTQAPFDSQPEVGSDPVVPSPGGAAGGQQQEQEEEQTKQQKKLAAMLASPSRYFTHPSLLVRGDGQPRDSDWQAPRPPGGAGLTAVDEEAGDEVRCTWTCALCHHAQSCHLLTLVCPPCLLRRRPQLQPRTSAARARPRRRRRRRRIEKTQLLWRHRRQRKPRLHLHLHPRRVSPPPPTWQLTCHGVPCGAASRRGRSPQWRLLPPRPRRPRRRQCHRLLLLLRQ